MKDQLIETPTIELNEAILKYISKANTSIDKYSQIWLSEQLTKILCATLSSLSAEFTSDLIEEFKKVDKEIPDSFESFLKETGEDLAFKLYDIVEEIIYRVSVDED